MRTIIYDQDVNAIDLTNPLPVTGGYNSSDSFSTTTTSPDATTAQVVKTATSGKSIYVTDIIISTSAARNIQLEDGDGTVLMYPIYLASNGQFTFSFNTALKVTQSKSLRFKASTSGGTVTVTATGFVA